MKIDQISSNQNSQIIHQSFVVRCWLEFDTKPKWRFELALLTDGSKKIGFATLAEMCTYVQDYLEYAVKNLVETNSDEKKRGI